MSVIRLMTDGLERGRPPRRVREDVRDGLAVALFSAAASSLLAAAMLLLTALAG
ncbi:MAG TPA: hypothetical protein VHG70_06350 [Nocardioidaceae bacterium]|jgi:hypothetical protein|nr:hypothetical protein [Nocardioidaceae bacterium]